jgi:galactonate dehydratase
LKITDIKTFIVHPGRGKNWLLVKVETDEGLFGWGESYTQADRDKAIEAHIHSMKRYIVGRNPFDIKHICSMAMYNDWATKRGAMDFYCAISGIEHALWDIVGKACNQPVYNLLGGRARNKIRVYANGWGEGGAVDKLVENAKKVVGMGFTALKFDPFPNPWRTFIDRKQENAAIDKVAAVRDAVGPDVDILVEVHRRLAPMHAVRVAKEIAKYAPFWYEEPVLAENIPALAEVKQQIDIPVVTGEELYTKAEFREVFERRAADIINPDICNCGGILELKEIAAMAEPYDIIVSPHNYNSVTAGLAASLQLCAHIPNFLILEFFVNFMEVAAQVQRNPFIPKDSYLELPTAPGLGIDIDEDALARFSYKEFPQRRIRTPEDEGP